MKFKQEFIEAYVSLLLASDGRYIEKISISPIFEN